MDYDKLLTELYDSAHPQNQNWKTATAIETLRADLARVTAERDAAISDLVYIANRYPVELCDDLVCQYCKHYPNINSGCPGFTENDCFEWRGQKED